MAMFRMTYYDPDVDDEVQKDFEVEQNGRSERVVWETATNHAWKWCSDHNCSLSVVENVYM